MDRGAWQARVHWVARVLHDLVTKAQIQKREVEDAMRSVNQESDFAFIAV